MLLLTGFTSLKEGSVKPDDSRFTKVILDDDLNEPMELAIAEDGTVYYIERIGTLNSLDPKTNKKKQIAKLNIRATAEDGLLGLALDPNFTTNRWLYLYFGDPTPRKEGYVNVLCRFELSADGLVNKKELLAVPLLHEGVNHSAGSLTFDSKGNLYLSTGDNTNPFESGGYSPSDDRPGRARFDALKSSGNTNDLRGKIIRIHPEADGTYTIPEGNLFPPNTPNTRPEIYVMGCRNPYRISIDKRTGFLYWGEVGPDAGTDSSMRGPRGHDEINQARKAGNFGWPMFVGNNKPYYRYDFDEKKSLELFDAKKPINFSRNNTGLKELPPAQSAFIWYPYADSPEFPELGAGGRNAMGGPVYYYDDYESFTGKFPKYFDKKLFIYDWMRGCVFTVRMKENGDLEKLERFLPETEFNHPVDMAFSKKGELYMLEYGSYWRAKNTDAKLVRIEYNEGNRAPVAKIEADKLVGAAPLKVQFSAKGSFDYDRSDSLKYEWFFTSKTVQGKGINTGYTFTKPGIYQARVRVTDSKGKSTENRLMVRVGNEPPKVKIDWQSNRSFFFGDSEVNYEVKIIDREDKPIAPKRTQVFLHYLPEGEDAAGLMATGEITLKGKMLIEQSDCKACHALNNKSVGPSYQEVAKRYSEADIPKLAEKIINGGGGVWSSDHVMSAHPQLLKEDASEMVRYILSLNKPNPQIASKGSVKLSQSSGSYFLMARYTDAGGLLGQDILRLRPAKFLAAEADIFHKVAKKNLPTGSIMSYNENGAWLCFRNLDLTGLKTVKTNLFTPKLTGVLEFRTGNLSGPIIAQVPIKGKDNEETQVNLQPSEGMQDVYVVYREQSGGANIWKTLNVRWLEFGK